MGETNEKCSCGKIAAHCEKIVVVFGSASFPPFGVCAWMETVDPVDYPAAIAIGPSREETLAALA